MSDHVSNLHILEFSQFSVLSYFVILGMRR